MGKNEKKNHQQKIRGFSCGRGRVEIVWVGKMVNINKEIRIKISGMRNDMRRKKEKEAAVRPVV